MARTAGEVGSHPVLISGNRAVRNAVAVLIEIAAEFFACFAPLLEILRR
jgi:hypothetical protein